MKKTHLLYFIVFFCSINLFAEELLTATLTFSCTGGNNNRTGIGYNPLKDIYYSVDAGSVDLPIETFSNKSTLLSSIPQGFDYRGAWWNSNTNVFEGIGDGGDGIYIQNLIDNNLPECLGNGSVTNLSANKPDKQSCGDYDPKADEIVYYYKGKVYRYTRSNHSLIESNSITNLPVECSNLDSTSIVVTGEDTVGVYDYINKALYLLDKNTAAYLKTIQLEANAPETIHYQMSFANNYLFLFDSDFNEWKGYNVKSSAPQNNTEAIKCTLTFSCSGGTKNRSGVAYNPLQKIYYSVNAGDNTYPLETFSESGDLLSSVTQGFDYRGVWWNSNTNAFEGSGFDNNGIFVQKITDENLPECHGTGKRSILADSKPDLESCGDYDPNTNEIVYYYKGKVYRYSRNEHVLIGSDSITNLPVPINNLNATSIVVTGEDTVGVYDYVNKALYLLDKNTAAYLKTIQLEANAPEATQYQMSFANNYLFLFDGDSKEWKGYNLKEIPQKDDGDGGTDDPNAIEDFLISTNSSLVYPNPFNNSFVLSVEANQKVEYTIINMSGQTIEKGTAMEDKHLGQHLNTGIYKVIISTDTGLVTETVIKQ